MGIGQITQVIGPVVDVEFPAGSLPEIIHSPAIRGLRIVANHDVHSGVLSGNAVLRCASALSMG